MANVKDVRNLAPVTIDLGGKIRTIQFDMNAFAELENKYGSVDAAMETLGQGKMTDIRFILWTGFIHEEVNLDTVTGEPTGYRITPFTVGSWIKNPGMLKEVSEKLALAMSFGMPDEEEQKVETKEAKPVGVPEGVQLATVVLTEEEKKAQEAEEAKNV